MILEVFCSYYDSMSIGLSCCFSRTCFLHLVTMGNPTAWHAFPSACLATRAGGGQFHMGTWCCSQEGPGCLWHNSTWDSCHHFALRRGCAVAVEMAFFFARRAGLQGGCLGSCFMQRGISDQREISVVYGEVNLSDFSPIKLSRVISLCSDCRAASSFLRAICSSVGMDSRGKQLPGS